VYKRQKKTVFAAILLMLTVSLFAQDIRQLNGTYWRTTISGNTELLLKLNLKGKNFTLTSRKGSTKDIVGGKYLMARMAGKLNATTIKVTGQYHFDMDTLVLTGKYMSLSSKQDFNGKIHNSQLQAAMTNNVMKGYRVNDNKALADYKTIAAKALQVTEENLYNPTLVQSKEWKAFRKKVTSLSAKVKDDYEFEKAFNVQVGNLPFSHYGVSIKMPENQSTATAVQGAATKENSKFEIRQMNDRTVLLSVKTFSASAHEIIPYIDSLKARSFDNLIIDLRYNGGGTIASALPLVSYLINDTLYGGLFLTRKYFASHSAIPDPTEYKNFPLFSEASFPLIIEGIHKHNGLCLVVYPDADNYKGHLYILTNKRTASTCEPLVYGLKQNKRATIVGERTAGAMLNGERFELQDKFNLWMPTADYYTVDGNKIDKTGVEPHISVMPDAALDKALEIINGRNE
jgi:hypothetical protein